MATEFITEDNPMLLEAYRADNYRIEDSFVSVGGGGICIIYFSGNNLYYPNTPANFTDTIINKDRYEWTKRRMKRNDGISIREIFVRDIYKQWYVKGINSTVSSIDALITLLQELTKDANKIITVGNSAGGYIAALIGCKLNASHVFCFSGQFDLHDRLRNYPILCKYEQDEHRARYYDITPVIRESQTPVYYFYPDKVGEDIWQASRVADCVNVKAFKFNQTVHGQTMYVENYPEILSYDREKLDKLYEKYGSKEISPLFFSLHVSGLRVSLHGFMVSKAKNLYVRIQKFKRKIKR